VRTGSTLIHDGKSYPNRISIEYNGPYSDDTHFIQFVYWILKDEEHSDVMPGQLPHNDETFDLRADFAAALRKSRDPDNRGWHVDVLHSKQRPSPVKAGWVVMFLICSC